MKRTPERAQKRDDCKAICTSRRVRKRVERGIAKLRDALQVRGVAVPAAVLTAAAASRTAEAAPAGLCATLHEVAYGTVTGTTAATHSAHLVAKGVMRMMLRAKIRGFSLWTGLGLAVVGVALAAMPNEYRLTDEPDYAPLEIPREVREAPAGFILDFYPDSWGELDLNGTWKLKTFQINEGSLRNVKDAGLAEQYYTPAASTEGWKDIPVPYSLGMHKSAHPSRTGWRGVAWYRRTFDMPSDWDQRLAANWRVLLRFEALTRTADAWVNGQPTGEQMLGPNAFEFDVTDKVRRGAENVLAVRVGGGDTRRGGRMDGLWQPVRLLCVPPTRAVQTRIVTPVDPPSLTIKTTIVHHGAAGTRELQAKLVPYSHSRNQSEARLFPLGTVALEPGENAATFRIKTPGVKLWSPDEPNLYLLSILDTTGRTEIFRERIGFRTVEAKNGDFYLNGNKIKLMGQGAGGLKSSKGNGSWCCNHNNHMRKILYALRQANINFMRPHGGRIPITMYHLCDELGMTIYDEYDRAHAGLYDPAYLRQYGKEYAAWVMQTHNRPSCILWDFGGNERYTRDIEMVPVFNYLYALLEKTDLQRRPKTSSSGRLTSERLAEAGELEKVDFTDSHKYTGYFFGSYQEWIDRFARHDRLTKKRYGNVPTLNCEWGFPGDTARYRGSSPAIRDLYAKDPWGPAEKSETGGKLRICRAPTWSLLKAT